ncbi:protein FAM53C-like [Conger conger]|uniref:protein FAM53C-like n=1 Tax=Conger conger TaxID=82655 RepID=UPI002A5AEDBF|nr:protein FAM53C-like [Conger conger]
MVTLITKQLQCQSLDEPAYRRAFSLSLPLPESHTPRIYWPACGLTPGNTCPPPPLLLNPLSPICPISLPPPLLPAPCPSSPSLSLLPAPCPSSPSPLLPSLSPPLLSFSWILLACASSFDHKNWRVAVGSTLQPSPPCRRLCPSPPPPPPPPPKRHCRPEDLPRCRSSWRPSASRVWTAVKRRCHSGGGAGGSCPLGAPGPSSPTLSCESPRPWGFTGGADCCCFVPPPSSSSSSSSPLPQQRRLSLSPVHVREATAHFLPPAPPLAGGGPPPSPSSACSTPASFRRPLPLPLPRCHSQPCGLKRRHAPDLPCPRPGLDFSKMTQTRSGDPLGCRGQVSGACGRGLCMGLELVSGDLRSIFSPAEGLGRTSICPLSESEEEEEEEEEEEDGGRRKSELEGPPQCLFERDCTELDLTLIEEN